MNNVLNNNLKNREKMITALKEEIIGPVENFEYASKIDRNTETVENEHFLFYELAGKNEEIIVYDLPSKKYAAGLLYPQEKDYSQFSDDEVESITKDFKVSKEQEEKDSEDENIVSTQNLKKQSTMGFTFAVPNDADELIVDFSGGQYTKYSTSNNIFNTHLQSQASGKIVPWWVRKTIHSKKVVNLNRDNKLEEETLNLLTLDNEKITNLNLTLYSYIRKVKLNNKNKSLKIVTITLNNKTTPDNEEHSIIFQSDLKVSLNNNKSFEKYPDASDMEAHISPEEKKFELLYLNEKNYAFGHDCSTSWSEENNEVREIKTTFLPEYEIKTMTPDIEIDGKLIEIHHAELACAKSFEQISKILEPLINGYKNWYDKLLKLAVPEYYESTKEKNLKEIKESIERIDSGINLLKNKEVLEIFQLSNLAMLMQMHNGRKIRKILLNKKTNTFFIDNALNHFSGLNFDSMTSLKESINQEFKSSPSNSIYKTSKWRGFQIAFLLQSLDSIVNKDSEQRDIVDLIWFPTGGGKTEAYLAVSAFSIFYRRYLDPTDTGVDVMMRYTLRLLTADQFQRSARLICSMDYLRSHFPDLFGHYEISIGLWVGASTSPNKIKYAKETLRNSERETKNKFILESCPWCGTEMAVVKDSNLRSHYHGYEYKKDFKSYCPDENCHFHDKLPIYFIDEQIYETPPSFLIGTIDKFVQLTWVPEARSIFGLDKEGERVKSPPNLIIQDELHLISGPLGSLAGFYELIIEELCTDKRYYQISKPKIISATATIKASQEQIKSVFGREKSSLFPPSGLDINDNFFSTVLVDKESGKPMSGRKYIGVYTSTQGKLQTQVQTTTSLITATNELSDDEKDPFYTLLSFYNSINDIGKARILLEQDIKNNIDNFYKKRKINKGRIIRDGHIKELTSRLENGEVSKSISELKKPYSTVGNSSIDVCLASNIIEVGVDIDRLSLMTINGQPKSSSQYIQVSGRVGRKTNERPGLVVTIYNPQNSSDKSHFEHFNEYHQKLYSQVEVSSVTPFSQFSINRGLPAVLIAFMRQSFSLQNIGQAPYPDFFEDSMTRIKVKDFYKTILSKAELVDASEKEYMTKKFFELYDMFLYKTYDSWKYENDNNGFMAPMNENIDDIPGNVKAVIFSMRNVDSSSQLIVRSLNYQSNKSESLFGNFD